MTRDYLVFETFEEAKLCVSAINIFTGKLPFNIYAAEVFANWNNPAKRLTDGFYVILHPKYHKSIVEGYAPQELVTELMTYLSGFPVQASIPEWWPQEELEES